MSMQVFRSILTKFVAGCVAMVFLVGGIVTANLLAFEQVQQFLLTMIDRGVTQLTQNAHLGRELSQVFSDSNLLLSTFIDQPEYVKQEEQRLLKVLQRHSSGDMEYTDALRAGLQEFARELRALTERCHHVNALSRRLAMNHAELERQLESLEDAAAEKMVSAMMEANEEELFAVEELSAMVPEYTRSVSTMKIFLAQMKQDALKSKTGQETEIIPQQFLKVLDGFAANLTLLATAGQEFRTLKKPLTAAVTAYQDDLLSFARALEAFQKQVASLKRVQEALLIEMEQFDSRTVQATTQIRGDATQAIQSSKNLVVYLSFLILGLLIGVGYYVFRMIRPIRELADTASRMANGDLGCDVPTARAGDEIGTLSRAFKGLIAYMQEMARAATEISQGRLARKIEPRSPQDVLGHAFREMSTYLNDIAAIANAIARGDLRQDVQPKNEDDVLGHAFQQMNGLRQSMKEILSGATQLSQSADALQSISRRMVSSTEDASRQTHVVSSNSQQISANVDAVAMATEELSSNMREIAGNTDNVAQVASSAVDIATSARTIIADLDSRSQEITEVITVISAISQQTNLLALNATIEAARAGDSGKGFAVVAHEIKELSRETAASAEDITGKLEAIRVGSREAIEAISRVSAIIGQIHDLAISIAGSVEQQSATTQDMTLRMSEAAEGSQDVTRIIGDIANTAQHTSLGASDVQEAAQGLADLAEHLHQLLQQFKL